MRKNFFSEKYTYICDMFEHIKHVQIYKIKSILNK